MKKEGLENKNEILMIKVLLPKQNTHSVEELG